MSSGKSKGKKNQSKQRKGDSSSSSSTTEESEALDDALVLKPPFLLCGGAATTTPGMTSDKKQQQQQYLSPSFSTAFSSVAKLVSTRKKVLVLCGAGTSVSCGIPDFRSKDKGLYATLDFEALGLTCPEELFDWEFFQQDPQPFYLFAKHLYFPLGPQRRVEPSDSHRFLALLEQRKQLLRVYTQNIDGLEERAGVSRKHMVYAHGSLQWATCCRCKRRIAASEMEDTIKKGLVPRCQAITKQASASASKPPPAAERRILAPRPKRRRAVSSSSDGSGGAGTEDNTCGGVMKPGVTFFGETLEDKVRRCLEADREIADAVIVIGTSLSVAPMSKVIAYLPPSTPRILINRMIVHPKHSSTDDDDDDDDEPEFRDGYVFDAYMLGFCDEVTRALVRKMNGNEKVKQQQEQQQQQLPDGELLANLKDDNEDFTRSDWDNERRINNNSIPHDRVLLFPGAIAGYNVSDNDTEYRETVHCDGCSKEIRGKRNSIIWKCTQCFDFDLCQRCYPKLSKQHYGGKHRFTTEQTTTTTTTTKR